MGRNDHLDDYFESDFFEDDYFDGEDLDSDVLYDLHDADEYEPFLLDEEEE